MSEQSEKIRKAMEQQEREQIIFKARNTTPLQRIQWVEEMLRIFAPFKRSDDSSEKLNRNPKSS